MTGPDQIALIPSEGWSWTKWPITDQEDAIEYIRRDPAVLAELPEVKALREALEEADRQLAYLDEKMPTGTTPSVRSRIAAAIREGRNAT